jgi:hypothetical protein
MTVTKVNHQGIFTGCPTQRSAFVFRSPMTVKPLHVCELFLPNRMMLARSMRMLRLVSGVADAGHSATVVRYCKRAAALAARRSNSNV